MNIDIPRWVFTAAWVFWTAWFVFWETLAILDPEENETLSGHIKGLMWQSDGRPTAFAFMVLPLLAWLAWHFYQEVRTVWTT